MWILKRKVYCNTRLINYEKVLILKKFKNYAKSFLIKKMFKSSGSLDETANFVWISSAFFVCKWDHWNPSNLLIDLDDLVYFTTRVPDTNNTSATQTTQLGHECYTNDTNGTRVRHKRKILILITTRVKACFRTTI